MPELRHNWLLMALCALVSVAPVARAQQQQNQDQSQSQSQSQNQGQNQSQNQGQNQGTAPIPAYHSPWSWATGNSPENSQESTAPDTNGLAGAQYLALGGLETTHSYWQPHVDVFSTVDSNPYQSPTGQANWDTWTSFSAGVDVHRISGRSDMDLSYTGGAMYSVGDTADTGVVQGLNFNDTFSFRRSTVSFLDDFGYLPEAAYGFGGISGAPLQGGTLLGGGLGLGPGFSAAQTVLTGRGQTLLNSFVTEVDTHLTPRSSLTFGGGYSLLHFFDSGLLNNGQIVGLAGYNYNVSERNTIAVDYTFDEYRYSGSALPVDSHTVQLAYARRVTGRLVFQVGAGPNVVRSSNSTLVNPSLNTALQYQFERTSLGLTYYHWVTGGSGVFAGASSDTVTGSLRRQMSRTFSSGITGGYARNHSLNFGTAAPSNETYNYWFAGATFSRPLSSSLGLTFSYEIQRQDSNGSFCIGTACGNNLTRHLISVGLGWHQRPLAF
jgi:hypothetical protein